MFLMWINVLFKSRYFLLIFGRNLEFTKKLKVINLKLVIEHS